MKTTSVEYGSTEYFVHINPRYILLLFLCVTYNRRHIICEIFWVPGQINLLILSFNNVLRLSLSWCINSTVFTALSYIGSLLAFFTDRGVCLNFAAGDNGSYLGAFSCPLPFEPEEFTACCGFDNVEFCCLSEAFLWVTWGTYSGKERLQRQIKFLGLIKSFNVIIVSIVWFTPQCIIQHETPFNTS